MKLLQIGAPKSGNFWLYKILKGIRSLNGQNSPSFIEQQPIYQLAKTWDLNYKEQAQIDMIDITDLQTSYRISSIFRMPIEDMSNYVAKTSHVWSHSPICKASEEVFSHFDKKVYIVRDPRDRAISAANYFCSPYMLKYYPQPEVNPHKYLNHHFDPLMREWVWHVFDHLKYSENFNIHFVFYESLLIDFQQELERLLDYLEIELTPIQKQHLEKEMEFSSMKKSNPKHLKKGTYGYWREHINPEQQERVEILAGPLLKILRYESLGKEENLNPPHHLLYDLNYEDLKREIIASQRKL